MVASLEERGARDVAGFDPHPPGYFVWERREGWMRVSERARRSVVFIGSQVHEHAPFYPHGTGFMCASDDEGFTFQYIVTAGHVIDGMGENICIRANVQEGGTEIVRTKKADWYRHPGTNPRRYVDVAVCPVMMKQTIFDITHAHLTHDVLTDAALAENRVGIGDELFVIGLFTQHGGEERNIPIVRSGTIAAMMEEPISTPDGFMDGYLIETHSIGGLSGSPVVMHFGGDRIIDDPAFAGSDHNPRHFLLGFVHGHFVIENPQDAVVEKDKTAGKINTGIGIVVPISKVIETVNQPALAAERKKVVDRIRKDARSRIEMDSAGPTAESELPTTADNPSHREDFTRLVSAAARKKPQAD